MPIPIPKAALMLKKACYGIMTPTPIGCRRILNNVNFREDRSSSEPDEMSRVARNPTTFQKQELDKAERSLLLRLGKAPPFRRRGSLVKLAIAVAPERVGPSVPIADQ